jgi:hypothetical protein
MNKNGSKTCKIWIKQGCRDLFTNNYRYQGLANKNPETQPIVLAKRINCRVRSEKDDRLDLVVRIC